MQIALKQTVIKIAKYLSVDVAVQYDDEDMAYDAPMREGKTWKATIDLDTKKILNWPEGKSLSFKDMKICDEGIYILLDENKDEITRIEGYVPNNLLPGDYGDYLSLTISEDGTITNWPDVTDFSDFKGEDD